jgi:hypothetical protein
VKLPLKGSFARYIFGDKFTEDWDVVRYPCRHRLARSELPHTLSEQMYHFWLDLDARDAHGWNVLTLENQLHSKREGWSMPLTRKGGHVYLTWHNTFCVFCSRRQLQNMHLYFIHPSTSKLFNLLERAYPEKLKSETWGLLEDIAKLCHACQTYASRPASFQVRFPIEIVFNEELRSDLMTIDGKAVLHIVATNQPTFPQLDFYPHKIQGQYGMPSCMCG